LQPASLVSTTNPQRCHSVMQSHPASQIAIFVVDTEDAGCNCLLRLHDSCRLTIVLLFQSRLQKSAILTDP